MNPHLDPHPGPDPHLDSGPHQHPGPRPDPDPHPHPHPGPRPDPDPHRYPLAELVRIESDPAYRALFCAELDAAIQDRFANRAAAVAEAQAAGHRLRALVLHGEPGPST
ncbi:hypothetical protein AB0899_13780 [Streptomyces sp. NPDC007002]|uniref:hypothetical protein n=1 Tax=Streptomyces sp. NPDC007002 TaxID=3156910 RepID=UPI0034558D21